MKTFFCGVLLASSSSSLFQGSEAFLDTPKIPTASTIYSSKVTKTKRYSLKFSEFKPYQIHQVKNNDQKGLVRFANSAGNRGGGFEFDKNEIVKDFTESPAFDFVSGLVGFMTIALISGTFSGYFTDHNLITFAVEDDLKNAAMRIVILHICSAALSGTLSYYKSLDDEIKLINMLRTFVFGGIDLLRVALSDDKDAIDDKRMNTLPPLQMHISSMEHMATAAPSAVLLNTNIIAKKGTENKMRKLLTKLHERTTSDTSMKDMLLTFAINQDIQERNCFMMTQRFPDIKTMSTYQNLLPFKQFVTEAEDLLESPMGLYLVNERNGVMGNPVYTFGPMGEGGRDDSIYSSPVNLDGSMVNRA